MSEQALDVAGSFRLIRDHWRATLVFVVVGLAASIGLLIVRPPLYTATSLVLLPGSSASSSAASVTQGNDMTTAAQVATSSGVLLPAGRQVDPSLSLGQLKQRVRASGVATNVLGITASGTNAAHAEALVNAVAKQLVAFETATGSVTDATALAGLRGDASQLTRQINDLNIEITAAISRLNSEGATSTAGRADASLAATLTTEQNQATLQLDGVNSQIAEAQLGASAVDQGTEVIQKATTANAPSTRDKAYTGMLGVIGGLFVGALLVLVRHRRDRRLHRRDELADAIGVPVLVSMTAPSRLRNPSGWIGLLKKYSPSAADRWSLRQALRDLELSGTPARLTILAVDGDTASVAAAPQIAIILSTLGIPTDFVLSGNHEFAAPLRSACNRLSSQGNDPRPNLRVWNEAPLEGAEAPALTVTCVVVDPNKPKLPVNRAAGTTLLAISAGSKTADHLARVAIAAADAGMPVKGMVLTNPDVNDRTTGRFPQVTPRPALAPHVRTLAARGLNL